MITDLKETKIAKDRLLNMYATLAEGKALYKAQAAVTFNCSLRSIQRDIEDLRSFFANQSEATGVVQELIYDRKLNAYRLARYAFSQRYFVCIVRDAVYEYFPFALVRSIIYYNSQRSVFERISDAYFFP